MAANKSQALIVFTYIERQHKRTKSACGYLGKVDFTILLRAKRVVSLCSSLCSPVYINLPNIIKLLSVIHRTKKTFLQERKLHKWREVSITVHDVKLVILIFLTSTHFFLKLFVNSLIYSSRKGW